MNWFKKSKDPRVLRQKDRQRKISKALKSATIAEMTEVPMEVQDLFEVPIYISMLKKTSVERTVEIKSPAL